MRAPVRLAFIAALILTAITVHAQGLDPDLQSMIKAELDFSMTAKQKNTRDAFLAYLRPDAVGFDNKGTVLMKDQWEQRPVDTAWLWWQPDYADVAASRDFGFDAGPWEYRSGRSMKDPLATGHFITIWKKENNVWKVAFDMGISHPGPVEKGSVQTTTFPLKNTLSGSPSSFNTELQNMEQLFIAALRKKGMNAYIEVLSEEARFYHTGKMPFMIETTAAAIIPSLPANVSFTIAGSLVAPSGDVGGVYGTVEIGKMKEGQPVTRMANYLHIWKKEDGKNWKLVLEVLADREDQ